MTTYVICKSTIINKPLNYTILMPYFDNVNNILVNN